MSVLQDDPATTFDERLTADTTEVPVYNFAVSRGKCDAFADAGAAGANGDDAAYIQKIRSNFGLDCNGVRLPATAKTLYTAGGKLNYTSAPAPGSSSASQAVGITATRIPAPRRSGT